MDRIFTPRLVVYLGLFMVFIIFLLTSYGSFSYIATEEHSGQQMMMTRQIFSGTNN